MNSALRTLILYVRNEIMMLFNAVKLNGNLPAVVSLFNLMTVKSILLPTAGN